MRGTTIEKGEAKLYTIIGKMNTSNTTSNNELATKLIDQICKFNNVVR